MNRFLDAPVSRRQLLLRMGAVAGSAALLPSPVAAILLPGEAAAAPSAAAQQVADHFAGIRTMSGDFVQFAPNGQQTEGKFYIQRPGRIRFDYANTKGFHVVSDGKNVVISNPRLKTYDSYQLNKTPLKLLLDERIDLSKGQVTSVQEEPDATTIVLEDKSMFGSSRISMMFDPASNALKQWKIVDAQGKETTVAVFNVRTGVKIDPGLFKIDYGKVAKGYDQQSNR